MIEVFLLSNAGTSVLHSSMIQQDSFNSIEKRLSWLATRLELRGALNILDLNIHAENFYIHFLKILYGWELDWLGAVDPRAPAIDLVDSKQQFVVQVSATATKQKINSALSKVGEKYKGWQFKFVAIAKPNNQLRKETYAIPHDLKFDPKNDIFDCVSLLAAISALPPSRIASVDEFLRTQLVIEPDPSKVESNLASIIKLLAGEDWSSQTAPIQTIPYEIPSKIAYNGLNRSRELIDDYKVHYHRLDRLYSEYDHQGRNKSLSIRNGIRNEYLSLDEGMPADDRFFATISKVQRRVLASANHVQIPDEELEMSVGILVVDAFIRCKIFKNPEEEGHANT